MAPLPKDIEKTNDADWKQNIDTVKKLSDLLNGLNRLVRMQQANKDYPEKLLEINKEIKEINDAIYTVDRKLFRELIDSFKIKMVKLDKTSLSERKRNQELDDYFTMIKRNVAVRYGISGNGKKL